MHQKKTIMFGRSSINDESLWVSYLPKLKSQFSKVDNCSSPIVGLRFQYCLSNSSCSICQYKTAVLYYASAKGRAELMHAQIRPGSSCCFRRSTNSCLAAYFFIATTGIHRRTNWHYLLEHKQAAFEELGEEAWTMDEQASSTVEIALLFFFFRQSQKESRVKISSKHYLYAVLVIWEKLVSTTPTNKRMEEAVTINSFRIRYCILQSIFPC